MSEERVLAFKKCPRLWVQFRLSSNTNFFAESGEKAGTISPEISQYMREGQKYRNKLYKSSRFLRLSLFCFSLFHFRRRCRFSEEVALGVVASESAGCVKLRIVLNALGQCADSELFCQVDNGGKYEL